MIKEWLEECDRICIDRLGVGIYDLEDWMWVDAYDDGRTPEDAVEEFLEDIGVEL